MNIWKVNYHYDYNGKTFDSDSGEIYTDTLIEAVNFVMRELCDIFDDPNHEKFAVTNVEFIGESHWVG